MRFRNALISLVALAGLSGCTGEPKHPTWSNATGSEQHEKLMWQAIKGKQWMEVERHLGPTFVGVDAAGKKYDRAGWLAYWKESRFAEYSIGEITVDPAGTDMVVSYIAVINGNVSGTVASNQSLRVISVWQSMKRGWMLTATSLTPIKE